MKLYMLRQACALSALLMLAGCGLADTAASGAVAGKTEADQAAQAKTKESAIKQQVEAETQQAAEQQVKAADQQSQ